MRKSLRPAILVIDDDNSFRSGLGDLLKSENYKVIEAQSAREGLAILGTRNIKLIISDFSMKDMHGLALFQYLEKKYNRKVSFGLMTGFEGAITETEALNLGIDFFIKKPFTREQILEKVKLIWPQESGNNITPDEEEESLYRGVHVSQVNFHFLMKFPIYGKTPSGKMMPIAHQGNSLQKDQIERIKKLKIERIYLKEEDYHSYLKAQMDCLPGINQSSALKKEDRTKLKMIIGQSVFGTLSEKNIDEKVIKESVDIVNDYITCFANRPDIFKLISELQGNGPDLFYHSLLVATVCSMLCRSKGWHSPKTHANIILGSLLHDIGLLNNNRIYGKRYFHFSEDELKEYKEHPQRGLDYLEKNKVNINDEVKQIILQHHELKNGTGFPKGLLKARTNSLAKLIGMVSDHLQGKVTLKGAPEPELIYDREDYLLLKKTLGEI